MNDRPPADWLEVCVRFVCGALLGGAVGLGAWKELEGTVPHGWLAVPVGGVLVGLAAAWFGDRFWRGVGSLFRW